MNDFFENVNDKVDFEDEETLEFGLGEMDSGLEETTWEWDGMNWTKLH